MSPSGVLVRAPLLALEAVGPGVDSGAVDRPITRRCWSGGDGSVDEPVTDALQVLVAITVDLRRERACDAREVKVGEGSPERSERVTATSEPHTEAVLLGAGDVACEDPMHSPQVQILAVPGCEEHTDQVGADADVAGTPDRPPGVWVAWSEQIFEFVDESGAFNDSFDPSYLDCGNHDSPRKSCATTSAGRAST